MTFNVYNNPTALRFRKRFRRSQKPMEPKVVSQEISDVEQLPPAMDTHGRELVGYKYRIVTVFDNGEVLSQCRIKAAVKDGTGVVNDQVYRGGDHWRQMLEVFNGNKPDDDLFRAPTPKHNGLGAASANSADLEIELARLTFPRMMGALGIDGIGNEVTASTAIGGTTK